jgi:plastocyanin
MNESLYPILKTIHATAMTIAFVMLVLREIMLLSGGYLQAAPRLYRRSKRIAKVSEPLAMGGILAGVLTALVGGWNLLTPWLVLAYALIASTFIFGGKFILPWEKRLEALEASPDGLTTAAIQPILRERRALFGRWLMIVIILSVMVVMRTKPSFGAVGSVIAGNNQTEEISSNPTPAAVSYRLVTQMGGTPGIAFVGVGGEIDGIANPVLKASVGDVVTITLVNGHNMPHNFTLDGLGLVTERLTGAGQESTITFTVTEAGDFAYFCSYPGHRQAGMAGVLSVSAR